MVKIEWTEEAIKDLETIYDYIAQDSIKQAQKYTTLLFNKVEMLGNFPKMGKSYPECENPFLRHILFRNYNIFYEENKDSIKIITILHTSRNIMDWFEKYKKGRNTA